MPRSCRSCRMHAQVWQLSSSRPQAVWLTGHVSRQRALHRSDDHYRKGTAMARKPVLSKLAALVAVCATAAGAGASSATVLAQVLCVVALLPCVHAQVSPKPFSKDDVITLLKGDVSPKRVIELVQQRGIDFVVTPEVERQLRKIGATDSLLTKLKESAPKLKASVSEPVAPTRRPPNFKAKRTFAGYGAGVAFSPDSRRLASGSFLRTGPSRSGT